MTFIIQVQVEAENVKEALEKIVDGNVISVNPRPQAAQQGGRLVTGGFQQSQTIPTPT